MGNPYAIGESRTREDVIAAYGSYLIKELKDGNPVIWLKMMQLSEDSILSCYCSPAPCHGNVIEEVWREIIRDYQHSRVMSYAGIGSRETPEITLNNMRKLENRFGELGFVLRSGGALGADSAFEDGADQKEIYFPTPGYNGRQSVFDSSSPQAFRVAEQLHPAWDRLSPFIKN